MMDVVIFQDNLLLRYTGLIARGVQRVERSPEICIHGLVAVVQREPIEAQLAGAVLLLHNLNVADVVRRPRLWKAGRARSLGVDPEHPVLEAALVAVVDQRDFSLRVFGELVVVIPSRHPEFRIRSVKLQPVIPFLVVEVTRLAIQELLNLFDRELHRHTGSGRWTRIEDSWVVEQRVGWCAMRRGGEPWRGLLII